MRRKKCMSLTRTEVTMKIFWRIYQEGFCGRSSEGYSSHKTPMILQSPAKDPFIKDLSFCHFIPSRALPSQLTSPELLENNGLNARQNYVLGKCLTTRMGFADRLVICQGPPGTGKTKVMSTLAVCNLEISTKTLIACSANQPLDVCASVIRE